jgi:hypothetical protein
VPALGGQFLFPLLLRLQRVDLLLQFLQLLLDLADVLLACGCLLEIRIFTGVADLGGLVEIAGTLATGVEMGLGEVVLGFGAGRVENGVGLFCLFGAAFGRLEGLLGIETNSDGLGRVYVDVLRLHHCDVRLRSDFGV